ncbi:MHYT domain-containing protein, NO-binding membrane sensor [Cognatiyoonia sediminum]|uniref:MHYT domain-containing protein, NO-binding membrane sensor n=1 Tax=Cognatiyoonia sediminum TaxID=1508389 RepID=A0A1M5S3P6_9RHOB|nr:MHYT domain-containing protein [Cognatiyoonia sediminum]SHH33114.1 MHYT domain-containing protein, NO-binding membrane sensor [Cognatiyoonia sediminum]
MEFLDVNHNSFLVVMSCIVAFAAGFTGLSLTRDLASKNDFEKKMLIALASVALGGGIWAMHFVAMLGLQMPILFYYDAAITLISALTAILIVSAALILLHFTERTTRTIVISGAIVGSGILAMHYIGMAGLELCRAVYTTEGIVVSLLAAIVLCVVAFGIAYGERTNKNIFLGTIGFAAAVASVHFLAMAGTNFVAVPSGSEFGPLMSNETLALGVIFFSFMIFGACLWVSITYLPGSLDEQDAVEEPQEAEVIQPILQIPCEREGAKVFVAADDVLFVRADGHYTQIYTRAERLFCAWPITEATKRLLPKGFLQTHRSYLVNPAKVARFERSKDKGICIFDDDGSPSAPVSRSKLKIVQDTLASQVGAIGAA